MDGNQTPGETTPSQPAAGAAPTVQPAENPQGTSNTSLANALGVSPDRPLEPQDTIASPASASSPAAPDPADAGKSADAAGSVPPSPEPGKAEGPDAAALAHAQAAAQEALKRLGVTTATPPAASQAASAGNKPNNQSPPPATPENIEKFLNPDGKQPADVQLTNAKKLIADAQSNFGKLGNELGPLRKFAESTREWFKPDGDGRPIPQLARIAQELDDATVVQQLQDAAPMLKELGLKVVPLETSSNMDALEEAAAKLVVPGEMSHEERMEKIDADSKLQRRLSLEVVRLEKNQTGRAESAAAQAALRRQTEQVQLEQTLMAEVTKLREASGPDGWKAIEPSLQKYAREMETGGPRAWLKFAHAQTIVDRLADTITRESTASYQAGYQAGLKSSGMIIPVPGAGAPVPGTHSGGDGTGSPFASPALLQALGLGQS